MQSNKSSLKKNIKSLVLWVRRGKKWTKKRRTIIGWENFLFSYFAIYTSRRTSAKSSRKRAYPLCNCMSMTVLISNIFQLVWFLHIQRVCMTESISLSPFYASDKSFRSACLLYMWIALIAVESPSMWVDLNWGYHQHCKFTSPIKINELFMASRGASKILTIELWRLMLATL